MTNIKEHDAGCLLCGAPLVYRDEAQPMECTICHKSFMSNAACEKGHFVCDRCHANLNPAFMDILRSSEEKDPMALLQQMMEMKGVHMNGPEHHYLLPCVLLTAYRNCGGELNYEMALKEAYRRGKEVPGGYCGYFGVCGAAVGAGIYASLVIGSSPVKEIKWGQAQQLAARTLTRIADTQGVRCCKRTTHIAIEEAVEWTKEITGVEMPLAPRSCTFYELNRECLYADCPYFE